METFQQYLADKTLVESTGPLYHVTHTKSVAAIKKKGLLPMQTSNWVRRADGERYGMGEIYTFTDLEDAELWAGKMDWSFNRTLGSGKISIIKLARPPDRKFETDHNDPLRQAGKKGEWLKSFGAIKPEYILGVDTYKPKRYNKS